MPREAPLEAPWTAFSDLVGLRTERKEQLIDLTELVAERVRRSGVRFGLARVQARHASAGVLLGEDGGRLADRGRCPTLGTTQTLQVTEGALQLERGQRVLLAELDGPRPRQISILVFGLPGLHD
jgi:thiamine phosphate synthase YjbQ (UPF0047 family)